MVVRVIIEPNCGARNDTMIGFLMCECMNCA
jgi:hypothetical protein